MKQIDCLSMLLTAALTITLLSTEVAWGLETKQVMTGGIHEAFKDRLKAAAQGKPTDTDAIAAEIAAAVDHQINLFVEQAKHASDTRTIQAARNVGESMDLVDCLITMLTCELQNDLIPEMEARSIRDTMDELDIQLQWDYSIAAQAVPAAKTVVRIRLPKLHPCPGCKKIVESALVATEGFENPVVDNETQTVQFLADRDQEIEAVLGKLQQSGLPQLAEWQLVRK